MKRIRTSLIGLGPWGQRLGTKLHVRPEFDLVGLADRSYSDLEKFASGLGAAADRNLESMLDRTLPDLLFISTPLQSHMELAKKALERGIHVWLTKPIVATTRELRDLEALARSQNRRMFFDHTFLFNRNFRKIAKALPTLSAPEWLRVSRGHWGGWQRGSSALEELIYHDVYMLLKLHSEKPKRLQLQIEPATEEKLQTEVLNIQYASGFSASLTASLGWKNRLRQVEWQGKGWKIEWEEEETKATIPLEEIPAQPDAIDLQLTDLARALLDHSPATVTTDQALATLKIIELARSSKEAQGAWVDYE